MDNFNAANAKGNGAPPNAQADEKPIPYDSVQAKANPVNRQPLSLGGSAPAQARPAPAHAPSQSAGAHAPVVVQAAARPTVQLAKAVVKSDGMDRICGVKTFWTKLHTGSITYMDEQINAWLKENPDIVIKHTNVVVGDLVSKTTEPNIFVTVWY